MACDGKVETAEFALLLYGHVPSVQGTRTIFSFWIPLIPAGEQEEFFPEYGIWFYS